LFLDGIYTFPVGRAPVFHPTPAPPVAASEAGHEVIDAVSVEVDQTERGRAIDRSNGSAAGKTPAKSVGIDPGSMADFSPGLPS
jgi:hypothetical protein